MSFPKPKLATTVLSLLLGAVFLVTGVSKIFHPAQFLSTVYSYGILAEHFGFFFALILPWLEVAIGVAMLSGRLLRGAFLSAGALLVIFVLAQTSVLASGRAATCGCALVSFVDEPIGAWTIIRTGVLAILAILGYVLVTSMSRLVSKPMSVHHVVQTTLIAVGMTAHASTVAAGDNGGPLIDEASRRLMEIHLENYSHISSYMQGGAIAPDAELQRIQALSARWLDQIHRGLRAPDIQFEMPLGGFMESARIPISYLNVAGEMQMFQAAISSRSGDAGRAGQTLRSATMLMEYLRTADPVSEAGPSHFLGGMLSEFITNPGLLNGVSHPTKTLLLDSFASLATDDPFGHQRSIAEGAKQWMDWAADSRTSPEGLDLLQRVSQQAHASLRGVGEMTDGEFALAAAKTDQFLADLNHAVGLTSATESRAALSQLRDLAQAGDYGPFAAILADTNYYADLAELRAKIDESVELRDDALDALEASIENGPQPNAADFYIEAARLADEAVAEVGGLTGADASKYADDVLILLEAGSECEWCDFTTHKDITAYVMPQYAPGLRHCIELLDQRARSNLTNGERQTTAELSLVMARLGIHLADDPTFASSALAYAALKTHDELRAVIDSEWDETIAFSDDELAKLDSEDPFGWQGALDATRLAWRSLWEQQSQLPAERAWRTFGGFALSADPPIAWVGILGLLPDSDRVESLRRLELYCSEVEPGALKEIAVLASDLIARNDQAALANIDIPEFDRLVPYQEFEARWRDLREHLKVESGD